jgi:hypothetical protein
MLEVRFILRHYKKPLAEAYGKAEGEAIVKEALGRFEVLLPDIPYIGGGENRNTKALSGRRDSELLQRRPDALARALAGPALLRAQAHGAAQARCRHQSATPYPDDWVFEVVEGDGHDFAFGVDYTECGVVKYLARGGARSSRHDCVRATIP